MPVSTSTDTHSRRTRHLKLRREGSLIENKTVPLVSHISSFYRHFFRLSAPEKCTRLGLYSGTILAFFVSVSIYVSVSRTRGWYSQPADGYRGGRGSGRSDARLRGRTAGRSPIPVPVRGQNWVRKIQQILSSSLCRIGRIDKLCSTKRWDLQLSVFQTNTPSRSCGRSSHNRLNGLSEGLGVPIRKPQIASVYSDLDASAGVVVSSCTSIDTVSIVFQQH